MTNAAAAADQEIAPVTDDVSELHAWALIGAGSVVTTLGSVSDNLLSPFAWVSALWFVLFQVGTSLSARRARNSWIRGEPFTLSVNVGCMVAFGLMAHEGFVQAFTVARTHGLGAGMSPELLWWVLFLVPFLEPAGFWTNAVHKEWRIRPPRTQGKLRPAKGRNVVDFAGKAAGVLGVLGIGLAPSGAQAASFDANPDVHGSRLEAPQIVRVADAQSVRRARIGEARKLHSEGASNAAIAKRLGVHRNTISAWLKVP